MHVHFVIITRLHVEVKGMVYLSQILILKSSSQLHLIEWRWDRNAVNLVSGDTILTITHLSDRAGQLRRRTAVTSVTQLSLST